MVMMTRQLMSWSFAWGLVQRRIGVNGFSLGHSSCFATRATPEKPCTSSEADWLIGFRQIGMF